MPIKLEPMALEAPETAIDAGSADANDAGNEGDDAEDDEADDAENDCATDAGNDGGGSAVREGADDDRNDRTEKVGADEYDAVKDGAVGAGTYDNNDGAKGDVLDVLGCFCGTAEDVEWSRGTLLFPCNTFRLTSGPRTR